MKKIGEKYQVLKKLGEGFGGSVFLVEAEGEKIALKQLLTGKQEALLSQKEILANFKQEFSTLKQLNHPNILRILDFGFDPKENFYYFTNEFIEGEDIFSATKNSTPEEIEGLFIQTLRALSCLHSQRVYHLDIKPSNILVTQNLQGEKIVKLIDFGLTGFRKEGFMAGTPAFSAPETILGELPDGRSDLYSLAVTWYTCLNRKNPFEGKNIQETITLQKVWFPPALSDPSNNIPQYLDSIFKKLFKKNPAERYHHADQVIREINLGGGKHYPLETDATALAYLPGEGKRVGHETEWAQLISFFERVFATRLELKSGVILSGPPGTGKSRLLRELKYHAQLHTISVLEGKESLASPASSDSLILIDNADEDTLTMVQRWMMLFHPFSIMIVVTSHVPKMISGWYNVSLKNFDKREIDQYVSSVLGIENPPADLIEELHARTEGNPLFLTTILQSLIQSHQLFDEQGRWSPLRLQEIGIDFGKLEAPQNLTDYCRSKYEHLSPGAQKILLTVAISQTPLTRHDLSKLGWGQDSTDWKNLREENLIEALPSGNLKLLNLNFREWVPKEIPIGTLNSVHQALVELFREDPQRKELAWYHEGFGLTDPKERFNPLLQYGDYLFLQNRWYDSARIFESAAGFASNVTDKVKASLRLIRPLFRGGKHHEALQQLEQANEILMQEKENPDLWRFIQQTLREMASIYIKEGRLDLAHETLRGSKILLEQHEANPQEEMILENLMASLYMREGKLEEAVTLSEKTYGQWQTWPTENKTEVLNNELANIYLAQGKIEKARDFLQVQADFAEQTSQLTRQAHALYGLAHCHYALDEFSEAIKVYQACAKLSRQIKSEELLFHTFNELGNIAYLQKNWSEASENYHHALELAEHLADINSSVGIAINLAMLLQRQGDAPNAKLYLRHVIDTLQTQPAPSLHQLQFLVQAYIALGRLYLKELKWIEARDSFRDAMQLIRSHTALENFRTPTFLGIAQADIYLKRMEEAQILMKDLEKRVLAKDEKEEIEEIKRKLNPSRGSHIPEKTKSA